MIKKYIKSAPVIGSITQAISGKIRKMKGDFGWFRLYWKRRKALLKNKEIKNTAIGRRCFILATGFSIGEMDLRPLAGDLSISVSDFFLHPDFKTIKPDYHIFPASHSPITDEQFKTWFEDAEKKMPSGQKVFVGLTDKPIVDKYKLFKDQNVYYYFHSMSKSLDKIGEIDFTKVLADVKTSPHTAGYLAFYLGCKEIYLLGVDHTWFPNQETAAKKDHFYENEESALYRAGYRPRESMGPSDLENAFRSFIKLWSGHKTIKRYADKIGAKIFNCSMQSLLDVFPKIPLESVIQKKNNG